MAPETPDFPGFDRDRMWATRDELLRWRPARDAAKPYPPGPDAASGGVR
jgi:NADH-quinone oxidoreductase subunit I